MAHPSLSLYIIRGTVASLRIETRCINFIPIQVVPVASWLHKHS